jgi:uncharacterized protein
MALGIEGARVRVHDKLARIEVPDTNIERMSAKDFRVQINSKFKELGFDFVTLDLEGYKVGSFNATLAKEQIK